MAYTPQTINPGDVLSSTWANKIEQEIARRGSFMGLINSKDDLPADPAVGDWYIKLKGEIFVWDGSKWQKVGGSTAWVSDTMRIDLAETYLEKTDISGVVDGVNVSFTLTATPIWPKTVTITVDGNTTITDNGEGELSDGGTIDYETGVVTLATAPASSISAVYHQAIWDGVAYFPLPLEEDFPQHIVVEIHAKADEGVSRLKVNIESDGDNVLVEGDVVDLPSDGSKHAYRIEFDIEEISRPALVYVQIYAECSPDAVGYLDYIGVGWL